MPPVAALLIVGLVTSACMTATSESRSSVFSASADATPTAAMSQTPAAETNAIAATPESPAATELSSMSAVESAVVDPEPSVLARSAEPSIGYISLDETQVFVQDITAGVREAAEEAGLSLIECDSGWTRPGVRACAAELAAAGVHGVISLQPFPDLTEEVCATLGDVPTVGVVYDQGPCQVSLFEIDQAESGRLAGAAMGELAARRWDCDVNAYVSLESGAEDPIGGARMQGYRDGFKEHCKLPKQTRRLIDAQHLITAQTQMAGVLDDIKGRPILVAGVSEDAILGAMEAASLKDRANHVWYSGQLADPAIRQTIACDGHYIASVAQFPERFGSTVVPTLVEAMGGGEVPPLLHAELQLVTAKNVGEIFPDTPACDE